MEESPDACESCTEDCSAPDPFTERRVLNLDEECSVDDVEKPMSKEEEKLQCLKKRK